ncbi:chemotaxis protein CheB [Niastella sp. OAS944]|uniref:chemotaxis protein CheB n=1 Tax=Niastella sp. OAS944 TaxID=2664089 RepID=UPI0034790A4B|nr:two-component system CheB/CheR fusion protein [Chitinophagaceae bacterium OAS944]
MKATQKHYVITVGASAGGLEAIQEFFDHMPQTGNMSFVVIQHLSPDYKSLLVDLVGRRTDMKVLEAAHNMPVLPNSVYVIPNNKQIRMQKGKLLLSDKVNDKSPNNAIDVFLHSLAIDKKDQAIAVILSGTGTDGTRGIAAIKENGGCVMVQVPNSAKFDGMPNSALASGYADVVDTPAGIAEAIVKDIFQTEQHQNLKAKEPDELTLLHIFELIYKFVGHDFHYYKTPTIIRRINKRMLQHGIEEPADFVKLLENDPEECKELAHDFLISVTKFFRDADAYKVLSEKVLPELIASKESGEQLKVWVSACSTGEEAYSIAMAIDQVLEQTGKEIEVKIFASDIDTANLDIASNALYPFSIESDVPEPLLNKYFVKKAKGWSVAQRLRKQIVFARHDITKDPPFIKNDLVTCRNMLIYMNNVLQDRIYAMLQFSLNKDGFLFLGPSENPPFSKSSSMQQISVKWKIFKKLADVKQRVSFSDNLSTPVRMPRQNASAHVDIGTKGQKDLWKEMRMAFLEDLGFIAFYIDRNFEIHETMGNYEDLLSLPKKMLNLNLIRMLPQDLSLIVNRELRKAWKSNKAVHLDCVTFGKGDNTRAVNILLKPSVMATGHDYTLVMFSKAVVQQERSVEAPATEPDYDYMRNLEAELAETKNSLQLAVEDLETANEELQSSNEELLSSNEELQSSNEELQSLNEELYTLNTEHQVKIKELVELNDDLNNYFRSTNIAQIFLDAQLNIRKFNPASTEIINFIESDLGRPFSDITANFKYNQLIDDIRYVERVRIVVEKEVALHQGKNFLLRIMPYITREKKYAGIIITFVDITTITNLNNIIRSVFNATTSAIFALHTVKDPRGVIVDFTIDAANEKAQEWFGNKEVGLTGKSLRNTVPVLTSQELFGEYLSVVLDDVKLHRDVMLESMDMWFELTAAKMPDGLVVTFTDITDKKKAVEKIRKNYSELNEVKENLRRLNKELEDKVKDRTRELSFSEERFRLVAQATNDSLWDWDLTANKVWWSDAFRKTFGYTEAQMTRKEWLEHVHPDDRNRVKESVHTAIHDNYNQWSQEYRFLKADGEYANVLDRGYILHNEFGVPYRMLGSMLDLTALRKAEREIKMMNEVLEEKVKQRTEQLQVTNQELESSNRDLQLFASVASHDLQEPLRKIHMLTKMVKDWHEGELGEDTVMYLNKIMHSAMRMKALVNNILHFTKLSNDFSAFEKTDIAQVIKEVREDFEMVIRDKNAEIRVSEIPQLEVIRSHIQQVFQNLIGNALKFSRKDVPPVITISAWRVNERSTTALPDAKGRWCHIEVKDNGIGFDEQFKTRIFDLFQRLNSKDKFEGTGIGLAIVKKIVEKHNGLIAANSQEGNGAVFSIILPLEQLPR